MSNIQNVNEKESPAKSKADMRHQIFTIIGFVLCVILVPILIVNCTLIVKSFINKDEAPGFAGIVPLIVLSDSMDPYIKEGDLIFTKKVDPKDIKAGDVLSFYAEEDDFTTIWTHRVVEVLEEDGTLKFRTQGDNKYLTEPDATLRSADKVVGVYTDFKLPGAGNLAMEMQKPAGLIICVVVPILLFVGYDAIRRRLYAKEDADSNDIAALKAELEALKAEKAMTVQKTESAPQPAPTEPDVQSPSTQNESETDAS